MGLKVVLPAECYGRIKPRSGLATKHFIDVGTGIIDIDYQGEILVLLFNHSDEDFQIKSGNRIAQLICEKIAYLDLEEIVELPAVEEKSIREDGGYGSNG